MNFTLKQCCTYRTVLGRFAVVSLHAYPFFNIFKFFKSRNRKCASFSLLGNLRATASKYGESHDSSENSDFFYCVKKTLLVSYFQKYTFKVPASSHFCEIWESSKYSSINQDGRWNLSKIVHFQHASTERRELAWISYSHSL